MQAIMTRKIKAGDVIIMRYEGPGRGPGMRGKACSTAALAGVGLAGHGGPFDRRPVLRRLARRIHRPYFARGGGGRTAGSGPQRRQDQH